MSNYLVGYHGTESDLKPNELTCQGRDATDPLGPGLYLSESLETAQRHYARDDGTRTFRVFVDLALEGSLLEVSTAYSQLNELSQIQVKVAALALDSRAAEWLGHNDEVRVDFQDMARDKVLQSVVCPADSDDPFSGVMSRLYRELADAGVRVIGGTLAPMERSGPLDEGRQYAVINDEALIYCEPVVGNVVNCGHCDEQVEPHLVTGEDGYPWCTVCPQCLGGITDIPVKDTLSALANQREIHKMELEMRKKDSQSVDTQPSLRGDTLLEAVWGAIITTIALTLVNRHFFGSPWDVSLLAGAMVGIAVPSVFYFTTNIWGWPKYRMRRADDQ